MEIISGELKEKLEKLGRALVDQRRVRIIVHPKERRAGYWFGGGNIARDGNGAMYLVGRYRNCGDSRLGTTAGERGMELAVYRTDDRGQSFQEVVSFAKKDLNTPGRDVLSIEGSCLLFTETGVRLFVSTEKTGKPYPAACSEFQKPGTGIWTIDLLKADTPEGLKTSPVETVLESEEPSHLHVKDPFVFRLAERSILLFANHPFSWASANTGYALLDQAHDALEVRSFDFLPRGSSWDVAISRVTSVLKVPRVGVFRRLPAMLLYFYDGGESLRRYDEHPEAVKRPRGYSCEELGGLAFGTEMGFPHVQRLSDHLPYFVSPWGSGSSRYTKILAAEEGLYAVWQQSQEDLSQPLVMNFLPREEIENILT
ncbi:MAG: hypothetical protein JXB06_07075 [Spirochaetales bacterium]|nr:hypothetical protein [Spirochaetales bacterium]